jgi:hypothetical protein
MPKSKIKKHETSSQNIRRVLREKQWKMSHEGQLSDETPVKLSFKEKVKKAVEWTKETFHEIVEGLKGNAIIVEDDSLVFSNLGRGTRRWLMGNGGAVRLENGAIILMGTTTVIKTLIAVLDLKGSKADICALCTTIINKSATSTYVTVPPATILALNALVAAYLASTSGTEQDCFRDLNNGMKGLMFLFQAAANSAPNLANAIILSGGFKVKRITPRKAQAWTAKNNPVQGIIDLRAAGGPGRSAHTWYYSLDGAVFHQMTSTIKAETQITGLASGITIYFMHELITKDGPQGFDLTIKMVVA